MILLDDLQKLDPDSLRFLLVAISELAKKHQPIYVLANGWPEITSIDSYRITKNSIFLQEFSCMLTANDLVTAINMAGFADFDFDPNSCKIIFPSVIELRPFINYLKGTVLHSLEDLLIQSRLFLSGDIAKESILERFYKLFSVYSEAEKLCN